MMPDSFLRGMSFGFPPEDGPLTLFSCAFLPRSAMGNLPKRETCLLLRETNPSFLVAQPEPRAIERWDATWNSPRAGRRAGSA
jgi:hypothetical protein